jgi:hypothetical protein
MTYITPTKHERREWLRVAQAAHAMGMRGLWLDYTTASLNGWKPMPVETFDILQTRYRAWLVSGVL